MKIDGVMMFGLAYEDMQLAPLFVKFPGFVESPEEALAFVTKIFAHACQEYYEYNFPQHLDEEDGNKIDAEMLHGYVYQVIRGNNDETSSMHVWDVICEGYECELSPEPGTYLEFTNAEEVLQDFYTDETITKYADYSIVNIASREEFKF